jgi:hypothetical protein
MITCANCNDQVSPEAYFCPTCGHAILDDTVRKTKSTADYYPQNPLFKPWKDAPLLPVRKYNTTTNVLKQPWYPTMKQGAKPKLAVKKSFPSIVTESLTNSGSCNEIATVDGISQPNSTIFQVRNFSAVETANEISVAPKGLNIENNLVREKCSLLTTFDIDRSHDNSKYIMMISLVEQTYGADSARLCWLRISLVSEAGHEDPDNNTDLRSSYFSRVLSCFSNYSGKLLSPKGLDWVELEAVSMLQTSFFYLIFLSSLDKRRR